MTAIPLGIVVGLPTIPIIIVGFLGNLTTVLLLILLVDKIRNINYNRQKQKELVPNAVEDEMMETEQAESHDKTTEAPASAADSDEDDTFISKRRQKARKIWDKYGLPGLTIIGTGILSSHITALMACTFGGNRAYVSIWMTISLAIWSVALGIAVHFGMDALF